MVVEDYVPETDAGKEMYEVLEKEMSFEKIIAVEVDHCPQSYACLIQSKEHGNIIYSGDTLPCQNFINYGQGVKVLIHEATLEDGMEEDALSKKHTTTSQAIKIGKKCKAWRTILTHFSTRYNKIAEVPKNHLQTKTLIALDHMRLAISQLDWAYAMVSVYKELLSNDD